MSSGKPDDNLPSLSDLDAKITKVTGEVRPPVPEDITSGAQGRNLAFAMRLASEFIAGIVVGTALGFFMDKWFGTSPFILITGFLLGFAAGIKTMLLTMKSAEEK